MIKEYFLCDFPDINEFVKSITGIFSDFNYLIFTVAIIVDNLRNMIQPVKVETRITMLTLAMISMTVFNTYHQRALDLSFEFSDYILSKSKITSLDGFVSSKKDVSNSENTSLNMKNMKDVFTYISNPVSTITNSIVLSGYWLAAAIGLGFCRIIFACLYIMFLALSPLIVYLSVLPGMENSMKVFWQTFIFFFISPIVFSLTLGIVKFVSVMIAAGDFINIEALIQSIILIIMLLGSFIASYYISTTTSIAKFASQASLMGAMAATMPLSAAGKSLVGAVTSPVKSFNGIKGAMQSLSELSGKSINPMGSSIKDISKTPDFDVKKFTNKDSVLRPHNTMDSVGVRSASPLRAHSDQAKIAHNGSTSLNRFETPKQSSSSNFSEPGTIYSQYASKSGNSTPAYGVADISGTRGTFTKNSNSSGKISSEEPYSSHFTKNSAPSNIGVANVHPSKVKSSISSSVPKFRAHSGMHKNYRGFSAMSAPGQFKVANTDNKAEFFSVSRLK